MWRPPQPRGLRPGGRLPPRPAVPPPIRHWPGERGHHPPRTGRRRLPRPARSAAAHGAAASDTSRTALAVRSSSPCSSRNRPRWRGRRDPAARTGSRRARPARQFGRCGPLGGVCSRGAATNRICGQDGIPCDHIVVIIGPFGSSLLVKVKACLILDSALHRPSRNGPWRPPPLMVSVTAS